MLDTLGEQLNAHKKIRLGEAQARARYHQALQDYVASVEQVVVNALRVFDLIAEAGRNLADKRTPGSDPDSGQVIAAYEQFIRENEEELQEVLRLERRGYPIAQSDEFKATLAEARLYARHGDRIRSAAHSLDQGRGRTLEEAMNELRHPPQ